ncbi:hypothetical protein [Actinokineospora sp. NPDC004072]
MRRWGRDAAAAVVVVGLAVSGVVAGSGQAAAAVGVDRYLDSVRDDPRSGLR